MLAAAFAFVLILVLLVMCTLGAVLLAGLFLRARTQTTRVLVSALAGCLGPLLPIVTLAVFDSNEGAHAALIAFSTLGVVASVVIGWPIAHFATRRLDRLIQFDLETFE